LLEMTGQQLRVEQWANFHMITSAAAATLLGLLFVAITLAIELGRKDRSSLKTYITPTATCLSIILLMNATLTIPTQTRLTTVICICLGGIGGLAYSVSLVVRRGGGISFYDRVDLFYYVVFPLAGYALVVAGGLLLLRTPQIGLTLVAAGVLILLGMAIRNSYAIVITIVSRENPRRTG